MQAMKLRPVKDNGLLAPFIDMLRNEKLLDFGVIRDKSDAGLKAMIRLQKYAFIAKQFGLNMGYEYNSFKYGPYSSGLACESYRLSWDPEAYNIEKCNELPEWFSRDAFLNAVSNKGEDWLEVASTMLNKLNWGDDVGMLVEETAWIKRRSVERDFVCDVFDDLRRMKLLPNVCQNHHAAALTSF